MEKEMIDYEQYVDLLILIQGFVERNLRFYFCWNMKHSFYPYDRPYWVSNLISSSFHKRLVKLLTH